MKTLLCRAVIFLMFIFAVCLAMIAQSGPQITSINPTSGPAGTQVTINGSNFGSTQGSGVVTIQGTTAQIVSWTDSQIVAAVAAESTTGNLVVQQGGTQSNGVLFTVVPLYSYTRALVLDHAKVSNSDQTNFPILVSGTYSYLATVSNGGKTQSPNGYDIIFTSDVGGLNKLDHEIESYNSATGAINFWVRIPALSHTTDTVIYLQYGNSNITSSQENKTGVWDSNFQMVLHLGEAAAPYKDSTSNGYASSSGTYPTQTAGKIGEGQAFTGSSSQYIEYSASPSPNSSITMETWVQTTDTAAKGVLSKWANAGNGDSDQSYQVFYTANGIPTGLLNSTNSADVSAPGTTAVNDGNWHHVAVTALPIGNIYVYTDGVQTGFLNNSNPLLATTTDPLVIGTASIAAGSFYMTGLVDEVRISNSVRSADWIATEYYNQNSPSSFYSLGQENTVAVNVRPAASTLYAGQSQQFTATVTGVANTAVTWSISPAGAGSVSSSGLYTAPASIASSQSVTITATAVADGATNGSATITLNAAPQVNSIAPTSGPVGSAVVISGFNFGPTQGSGSVAFNGTSATVSSWANSSITALVPSGSTSGNIVVTAGSLASNGVAFTVVPGPTVSSISPNAGAVGAVVNISGSNLATAQASPLVTFNGSAAALIAWSSTGITVAVPAGAATGNVVVTVDGAPSNGVAFTVNSGPAITSLSPDSGGVGTVVTVAGANFGASQGSGVLTFNGVSAPVSSWSDTAITTTVPLGAATGNVVVTSAGALSSNGQAFTVNGNNGNAFVGPVTYSYDSLGRLISAVAATGDSVTYNYDAVGNISSITRSTSALPSITSFSPLSGPAGTQVTITGTNFSPTASQDQVQFNGSPATVTSASATQLSVLVPLAASTGPISVIVPAGTASSPSAFVVSNGAPPHIDSFTPQIATAGSSITLTGGNFNPAPQFNQLSVNTVSAAVPGNVSVGSMTMTVPTAGSGHISISTPAGVGTSTSDLLIPPSPYTISQVAYSGRVAATATGAPVTISIGASGGIGMLLFDGTARGSVAFGITSNTFGQNCTMQLYNPDASKNGASVKCVGANFVNAHTLPTTGTYTLLVDPQGSTGSISLLVYDASSPAGTINTNGTPFTVTSTVPGQSTSLSFNATQGQDITLIVDQDTYPSYQGSEGLTIQVVSPEPIRVLGIPTTSVVNSIVPAPDVAPVAFMGDLHFCFNSVINVPCPPHFRAPMTGSYTLLLTPAGPVTGSVRLRLYVFNEVAVSTTLGNITSPSVPISLTNPGQVGLISFPVNTATQSRPTFAFNSGNFRGLTGQLSAGLNFLLLDPSGVAVGGGCCAGGPIFNFPAGTASAFINYGTGFGFGSSGIYTLWLMGVNDTTGSLNLNLYDATDVTINIAADGTSHTITTNAPGQRAFANFPATQGQRLFGVVSNITGYTNPATLVSLLEQPGFLFNAFQAGNKIFMSSTDGSYSPLIMPGSGTDTVQILPTGTDTGSATVTLYTVPPDVSGTIDTAGDPVTVTTTTPGQKASLAFTYSGSGNGNVTLTISNGSYPAGECGVTILTGRGQPWTQTMDCSGASQSLNFQLFGPDPYIVFIEPLLDATGSATFQITTQ